MTYSHHSSPHETAVNAVNADATADLNTPQPTDTSVNAVGYPKPPARKTANPGSKPPPYNQPVWVLCSKHWKERKQTDMDYGIHWGITNSTLGVCRPNSPCNVSRWAVSQKHDWAVKGGKSKGGKP